MKEYKKISKLTFSGFRVSILVECTDSFIAMGYEQEEKLTMSKKWKEDHGVEIGGYLLSNFNLSNKKELSIAHFDFFPLAFFEENFELKTFDPLYYFKRNVCVLQN
jgi:hypothetical protein